MASGLQCVRHRCVEWAMPLGTGEGGSNADAHAAIWGKNRSPPTYLRFMNAYLVDGVRSPIGSFGGTLAPVRADDLAAHGWLRCSSIRLGSFGDWRCLDGLCKPSRRRQPERGPHGQFVGRASTRSPAETINRLCASGLAAAIHGARMLHLDDAQVMVAGGVEHMTRGPWVMSKASKPFGRDVEMHDSSFGWRFINPKLDALWHGRHGPNGREPRGFAWHQPRRPRRLCEPEPAEGGRCARRGPLAEEAREGAKEKARRFGLFSGRIHQANHHA